MTASDHRTKSTAHCFYCIHARYYCIASFSCLSWSNHCLCFDALCKENSLHSRTSCSARSWAPCSRELPLKDLSLGFGRNISNCLLLLQPFTNNRYSIYEYHHSWFQQSSYSFYSLNETTHVVISCQISIATHITTICLFIRWHWCFFWLVVCSYSMERSLWKAVCYRIKSESLSQAVCWRLD
jgi:hypothetical protein